MEPNQTYKFYTAKETIKNNNKKRQPTDWEKCLFKSSAHF